MNAKVTWQESYKLEGQTGSGKTVRMDTGKEARDPSPAELVLQALAGCTMMDVVLILTKGRKKIDRFWVDVEAKEAADFPRIFTDVHLVFNLSGSDLDRESVERAVKLSHEKYCRVSAMLRSTVRITTTVNLV